MTYGFIAGSERLRSAIAGLYEARNLDNVLVTHGAIGANALIYQSLVDRGDRVVTFVPTYQQHYSIPESLGADVQRLHLRPEDAYLPDLAELRRLVTPGTKLIAFSNPNNPTGSLMDRALLAEIVHIAGSVGAYVLSDEVYRGTAQMSDSLGVAMADLYPRGISVGIIDDVLSSIALENRDKVLARSRALVRANLATLDRWMHAEKTLSYVKPLAGTIALLKYSADMPSEAFCVRLLQETGVLMTPGSAFEVEGTVRIGYANNPTVLEEGLRLTSAFLGRLAAKS